jgi:hypothetical protein
MKYLAGLMIVVGDTTDDCTIISQDRVHAITRLAAKYAGEPVQMQESLEHCIAPTGTDCERVTKLFAEFPGMAPKWAKLDGTNTKHVCDGMPPALAKCLFPSYVIGHRNDCTGAPGAARAAAAAK